MVIFWIRVRRSYQDLSSQADPARENWTWSYTYFTFRVSWKHMQAWFFPGLTLNWLKILPPGFFSHLTFAIIAPMLCGNHLNWLTARPHDRPTAHLQSIVRWSSLRVSFCEPIQFSTAQPGLGLIRSRNYNLRCGLKCAEFFHGWLSNITTK